MSNIGKKSIKIPENVEVTISPEKILVKGPNGQMERETFSEIAITKDGDLLNLTRKSDSKKAMELHGLTRSLVFNMIDGVVKGFEKKLKMVGVGFKAQIGDNKLILNVGFSHPVEIDFVPGVDFKVEKNTIIIVSGIDKELVGRVAAKIRAIKKPEPYKGKGIMYEDEKIRRKAGKALKSGPGAGAGA